MALDDTTVKLLNLVGSRRLVAQYLGMADLSVFNDKLEKLDAVLDKLEALDSVPPELSQYSLGTIHNAAKLVRVFIGHE